MVGDLIGETRRRIEESGVESVEEVRSAGRQLAGFSEELAEKERVLKRFLYDRLYNASALVPVRVEAQRVVAGLFAAYRDDPSQLPEGWRRDEDAVRATRDRRSLVHALIALSEVRFNDPACAATFASKPSRLVQRIERIAVADMNDAPKHSGRRALQLVAFALGVASISLPAATLRPEQAVNHIPWLAPSRDPTPAALEVMQQERKIQRNMRDAERRIMRNLF